eukprot:GAHX01001901.1.p1 GENE.GAHX01001901.1~~GAHX01001901.1.p1  ORF type:complete len:128 (+),score=19.27 GAHX01001901.1:147-530(+)
MLTFTNDLVRMFLECDIPLNKFRYNAYKVFMNKYDLPTISQSNANKMMNEITLQLQQKIIKSLENKKLFVIIDESQIKEKYIVNLLTGSIDNPNKTYLIDCKVLENAVNSDFIVRYLDEKLLQFGFT